MAKRRSARSTDGKPAVPALKHALAFASLANELVPLFAPHLGVAPTRDAVLAVLASDAEVAKRLERVPAPALAVLERLVEAEGDLGVDVLVGLAPRLGLTTPQMLAAMQALERQCLLVIVIQTAYGSVTFRRAMLVDVSSAAIASRVRGLTIPSPPREVMLPEAALDPSLRDRVALIASVVHVPIRSTQHGDSNRTSVKKLASMVGWEPERVAGELDRAAQLGVIGIASGRFFPFRETLGALARGELAWIEDERVRAARAWAAEWISRDAVVRALVARRVEHLRRGYYGAPPVQEAGGATTFSQAEAVLDQAGLETIEHDGHAFVRAPRPLRSGHGDGHVTPSFEVMLGPAADPELVATLALATEPGRMDVVLTRRLTPASVAAAIAAGVRLEELLEGLGRVGRHGVPDNVRVMVEEWGTAAKTVRIRKVWALDASTADAGDALARALGDRLAGRPSPTVLLVTDEGSDPAPLLVKSGVQVIAEPRAGVVRGAKAPADVPDQRPLVLDAVGDPAVRARYHGEREVGLRALELEVPSPSESEGFSPADALAELADAVGPEPKVRRVLAAVGRLWAGVQAEYEAWAEQLAPGPRDEALGLANAMPLEPLPWLVLGHAQRAAARRDAHDLQELLEHATRHWRKQHALSPDGKIVAKLLTDPRVIRALAELVDEGDADDSSEPFDFDALSELIELPRPAPPATKPGQPSAAAKGGKPSPASLGRQPPDVVRAHFFDAASRKATIWLRVNSKTGGDRVLPLLPERILERGHDVALLGIDPETKQNRSFPLSNVLAVSPA